MAKNTVSVLFKCTLAMLIFSSCSASDDLGFDNCSSANVKKSEELKNHATIGRDTITLILNTPEFVENPLLAIELMMKKMGPQRTDLFGEWIMKHHDDHTYVLKRQLPSVDVEEEDAEGKEKKHVSHRLVYFCCVTAVMIIIIVSILAYIFLSYRHGLQLFGSSSLEKDSSYSYADNISGSLPRARKKKKKLPKNHKNVEQPKTQSEWKLKQKAGIPLSAEDQLNKELDGIEEHWLPKLQKEKKAHALKKETSSLLGCAYAEGQPSANEIAFQEEKGVAMQRYLLRTYKEITREKHLQKKRK